MKHLMTLLSLWAVTCLASAQTGGLSGTVYDRETGRPLAGAVISLSGLKNATESAADGHFYLARVPVGRYTLNAAYLGYKDFTGEVEVRTGNIDTVEIRLQPTPILGKEVTVVATRAVAGQTPAAFSDLSKEEISLRYFAQDIPVLLSELPSTTFYSENGNGIGYNYLSIRGFDQRRISVMINGVPQNDPEDHNVYWLDFPDFLGNVEDIQVQRGAGSAFYGPPAIGGSLNIISSSFSAAPGISAYSGVGTFGTRKFSLSLNSGLLKDSYVFSARASQIRSDGYRDHSGVDFKSYFLGAAHFGKRSSLRLHFYGGPIEDSLAFYGISKTEALNRGTRRNNPITGKDEIENFNQPHLELIHQIQLNKNLALNNTLFGIRGYGFFDFDGTWAPFSYFRLTPEFGFQVGGNPDEQFAGDVLIRAFVDNKQAGWLPNLIWEKGGYKLVVGSEIRLHRSLHWGRIQAGSSDLPPAISGKYQGLNYIGERRFYQYRGGKDIFSPYLQATLPLATHTQMMLGLQYAHLRYRLYDEKFVGSDFSVKYDFINPRVGINHHLRPDLNLFLSFSRTSREPRLKNLYDAAEASTPASWGAVLPQFEVFPDGRFNFAAPLVRPEKLNDVELGMSYRRGTSAAHLNLFYMDFRDEIVKSGQLDRFGQPVTGNAPRSLHAGLEAGGQAQLSSRWTAGGNLTFSRNRLKEYTVFRYDIEGNVFSENLDGNPIAGFPDFMANARLNYHDGSFNAALVMQHVGRQFTDNFNNSDNRVDPYTVFHGMAGYRIGGLIGDSALTLQLHVQNLFDKLYISHGEGSDFFPAAERQIFLSARIER